MDLGIGIPRSSLDPFRRKKARKPFKVSIKKIEWNRAAGRNDKDFKSTSKCRSCQRKLIWMGRSYDFDHKDNNPSNDSQNNCHVVCKVCHGKHTVLKKRKIKNFLGQTVGYKTIKKKVGYKKSKRKKRVKKKRSRKPKSPLGNFRIKIPIGRW